MRKYRTIQATIALCAALSLPLFAGTARDLQARILEVSRLINKDRDNLLLYEQRARLHRSNHDWPAAMTDYGRIEGIDPAYPRLRLLRAQTWLEAGRPDAARPLLESFLFEHPSDAEALIARARALALLASPEAAAADLDHVIATLNPAPPEIYVERSIYQARVRGRCAPGVTAGLTDGMDRMGPAETLVIAAVDAELRCDRWQAALDHLERLPHSTRAQAPWLVRRAEVLAAGRQHDAARRTLLRAREQLQAMNPASRALEANVALARRIDAALGEM